MNTILTKTVKKLAEKRDYYIPDWRHRLRAAVRSVMMWKTVTLKHFFSLAIYYIVTSLAYAFLILLVNQFWFTIKGTPSGTEFLTSNPSSIVLRLFSLLEGKALFLSWRLSLDVLITSLLLGLVMQVLPIRRWFFDPYNLPQRVVWFAVFALITALDITDLNYPLFFDCGVLLYFFPACCLVTQCLRFSGNLFPEITLIPRIWKGIEELVMVARIRGRGEKQ